MGYRMPGAALVGVLSALFAGARGAEAQNVGSFRDADHSASGYTRATVTAHLPCDAVGSRVGTVEGTRLTILSAELRPAAQGIPEFCRIVAVLDPEIQVEVALPYVWNRRLYMRGNGGYAGERLDVPSRVALRDEAVRRGFVAAQTNTGHDGIAQPLGSFAQNDLGKLVDYAHRAVHLTAAAAKRMAEAFYGRPPAFSYFDGCSTGGRQGLISAQRSPGDFDGIVAGAPVLNFTGTMYHYRSYGPRLAEARFTSDLLAQVGRAIVAKCDASDGLKDGLVRDPRTCRFDPRTDLRRCPVDGACFSEEQVVALEAVHADLRQDGRTLFPGWPWGSEAPDATGVSGWAEWFVSIPPAAPPAGASVAQALPSGETRQGAYAKSFFRYFADQPASQPDTDWRNVDAAQGLKLKSFVGGLVDATDPDLSAFKARGGRMISYFGWADPALNPLMGVAYYEAAARATPNIEDAYRLFMVPGMQHCGGGDAPNMLDPVTAVIDWVETGKAPATLLASQRRPAGSERSRPLCPYPQAASYLGGDPDKAESFVCRTDDGR